MQTRVSKPVELAVVAAELEPHRSQEHVALALGVSLSTVQRRIRAGQIQVVRVGRAVRVPQTELARLLSSGLP